MEMTDSSGYPIGGIDDYNLFELTINEENFDQFIFEGENGDPIVNFHPDDNEHLNDDCAFDNQFNRPTFSDPSSFLNSFPCEYKEYEEENCEEKSSATITTTTTTTTITKSSKKGDKIRTIISERKRRGRMKEKLYALRALVPNITKMDKASIVGDAAVYLQELQTRAKKLRVDIERLELLLKDSYDTDVKKIQVTDTRPISKKILQIDVLRVEEKGIYVRVVCNKGKGIAASLYKALESFSGFVIQTSNLATVDDKFLLTFTLNVKELCEMEMDLGNLKLWVAGALLNQGFDFMTFPSA